MKGLTEMKSYNDPNTGEVIEMTDAEFSEYHDQILTSWQNAKASLDAAKASEMELRKIYVAMVSDPSKTKGTENIPLGNGYKAKIVKKENFGWIKNAENKTDIDAIHDAQDAIEAMGNEGSFLADRLLKWSAELSVSEYNKLDMSNPTHQKIKARLDTIIVTSPGSPTLEVVAPK